MIQDEVRIPVDSDVERLANVLLTCILPLRNIPLMDYVRTHGLGNHCWEHTGIRCFGVAHIVLIVKEDSAFERPTYCLFWGTPVMQ